MDTFTTSERELLKAIYRLSDGASRSEAPTGDIAERLGRSPSTVTTAVERLADGGLVPGLAGPDCFATRTLAGQVFVQRT